MTDQIVAELREITAQLAELNKNLYKVNLSLMNGLNVRQKNDERK